MRFNKKKRVIYCNVGVGGHIGNVYDVLLSLYWLIHIPSQSNRTISTNLIYFW